MKFSKWFFIPAFILVIHSNTFAQSIQSLQTDEIKTSEIGGKEVHIYEIDLDKEQFFLAELFQNGIDLMIRAFDPTGKEIGEFDSPNGTQGPEPIQFSTMSQGKYQLKVSPLNSDAEPGAYTIQINTIEPVAKTPESKIDQLFAQWNKAGSPGGSVAVVKEGKLHYSKGYGYAQLEYDIPIESSTIFHIASVSKQFTAFAIAMLADQGKISLDDDIRKYLPEVPDFGKMITLRHLAHHTSGLRDQWNLLALAGWRLDDVITKEHVLKLVANQKDLNFDPGSEYVYCNTGFTLLAEIVARVSEKSFAEWCQEHIFRPLQMDHTHFYDNHQKIVKNRAYSYANGPEGFQKSVLSYANVGATSLFTTVDDLAKWSVNFKTMTVGNQKVMDQMHEQGILTSGDTIGYALGQGIGKYKGLNMVSHGGADAGYRTWFGRFPDQDFAVIVFSNLGSFNPGGIATQIADIYLESSIEKEDTNEDIPVEKVADANEEDVEIDQLKAYCGRYELQPGFVITVAMDGEKLVGRATGQPQVVMQPRGNHTFFIPEAPAEVVFEKNDEGIFHQLILKQGGGEFTAPRLDEFDVEAIDLNVYAGKYYSEELQTAYTLLVEEGKLVARHQRHPDIILTPSKKDEFSGSTWFFGLTSFEKDADDRYSKMSVSSGRVRNLVFSRIED
jgi:CubicO group peptidase (beta-lactamase class C family)